MALEIPESMDDCLYFTNRTLEPKGQILAWVHKKQCPKCKSAKMGKPIEKGKVKIRATVYVCPSCGFEEDKKTHEESLKMEAQYTCPHCEKEGESSTIYKRNSFQGVPAFVIECQHCKGLIPLTKKLKNIKEKKSKAKK
ncbi:hypothetical protein COV12_01855 [Candidatus Woesearchaeota archaeon CG10_big_fil_rev_8_21_14_0_10_32_24]|nr:MAG: hypothetical protein COV12_01855 [Candidatus Woesearchaeota archaeon CG10_big_fil_rev_8_21_14_0_10_32_24]